MINSDGWLVGENHYRAHDMGGTLAHPSLITVHYTAGVSMEGALSTLTGARDPKVSAHFVVGADGEIAQLVPCKRIAYHAGESVWRGRRGCNSYSIGIELVNPGHARSGVHWSHSGVVRAVHKHGGPIRDWYEYPQVQYEACARIVREVWGAYGECEVVGHDDIAPGRKIDPGPAFSFARLMGMCQPIP